MGWISKLITGVDLDEEQKRSQALDAKIAEQNKLLVERGLWTQDDYDAAQSRIDQANAEGGMNDVTGAVTDAGVEGAKEAAAKMLKAPGDLVGAAGKGLTDMLWNILKNIPIWVYVALGVALFIWMGGLALLRGRLAKGNA